MARKQFIADVASAKEGAILGVSNVKQGDEDGNFEFCYTPVTLGERTIKIKALATDVSAYPAGNQFLLFTDGPENVPKIVSKILDNSATFSYGVKVSQLLTQITRELNNALADGSHNNPFNLDNESDENNESDESEDEDPWPYDDEGQGATLAARYGYVNMSPYI
jgi:hypothetical protein